MTEQNSESKDESEALAQANRFGKALATTQEQSDSDEFTALLEHCNDAIDAELDIDYGDVCDTGSDCC